MTRTASGTEVPPGVPALLRAGQVMGALNVEYATVKRWFAKGKLPAQQDAKGEWRLVKTVDLIRFADERDLDLDLSKTL
jgi:hypothetical protein